MEFEYTSWFVIVCWVAVVVVVDDVVRRGMSKVIVESPQRCGIEESSGYYARIRIRIGTGVYKDDKGGHHSEGRKVKEAEGAKKAESFGGGKEWDVKVSKCKRVRFDFRSTIWFDDAAMVNGSMDKTMDATKEQNKAIDRRWQYEPP